MKSNVKILSSAFEDHYDMQRVRDVSEGPINGARHD